MQNINIIVMGKTGSGKSTLINSILEEDLAPTGVGQAVTKVNTLFSKKMMLPLITSSNSQYEQIGCILNMYDTVGLEIDNSITQKTLTEVKNHILDTKAKNLSNDIHMVWFCVNERSSRFEPYEIELIRSLSLEYEIPFIIVLTQCISGTEGELEKQIRSNLPEITCNRILAKDYKSRAGTIPAYGITELLQLSYTQYRSLKVQILEQKLRLLDKEWEAKISKIRNDGQRIINRYSSQASSISRIPGLCIPLVHSKCKSMINELNATANISFYADDAFANAVIGMIGSIFMLVPLVSIIAAESYIESVGEGYLTAVLNAIQNSNSKELNDNTYMKYRIKQELSKLR